MKKTLILLIIVVTTITLGAQPYRSYFDNNNMKNQIFMEALGNGIKYSLNYERHILQKEKFNMTTRIGWGYYLLGDETMSIPFEFTGYFGDGAAHLETGLGVTFCRHKEPIFPSESYTLFPNFEYTDEKVSQFIYSFRLGLRYRRYFSSHVFRIGITVLLDPDSEDLLYHPHFPLGISYGYRF